VSLHTTAAISAHFWHRQKAWLHNYTVTHQLYLLQTEV